MQIVLHNLEIEGIELISIVHHTDERNLSYTTTVVEALADVIGVDPMCIDLELEKYIPLDAMNRQHQKSGGTQCAILAVEYGGYLLNLCFCGEIAIYAPEGLYDRGNVPIPDCIECDDYHNAPRIPGRKSSFSDPEL